MHTIAETYFSTLKVPVSFDAGEFIAVGMLLVDSDGLHLRLSHRKIKILKDLINSEQYELLRTRLRSLETAAELASEELGGHYIPDEFSISHLNYLSRYSNNILLFSEPTTIKLKDSQLADILYSKYVDPFIEPVKRKQKPIKQRVRSRFSKHSVARLSWDFEVSQQMLPSMPVVSYKSHFAGIGEGIIIGDSFDFELQYHLFSYHLSALELIARTASPKNLMRTFVVGKEPDPKLEKNHQQWNLTRKSKYLEYIDLKELGRLEEFLEEQGIEPV